jgi:cell division protease FtsH
MVTEFGMSEALGPVRYAAPAGSGYLGPGAGRMRASPETERLVDQEIRRIVEDAQKRALEILARHEAALHAVAKTLQEKEVIPGEEIARLVQEAEADADTMGSTEG